MPVNVRQAKDAARAWVAQEAAHLPGFAGAFFHGSIAWLPDDAPLPPASDVDVIVVRDAPGPQTKLGKLRSRDVILDVSALLDADLRSPAHVLSQYHLAGSLRAASIIADPSGRLTALQAAVARDYAKRRWVAARCAHARAKVERNLRSWHESDPLSDQVTAWLFAAGVTTHVLLVAGLRNPTVRRRYLAVRDLLADYGRRDFYAPLLGLLGCAALTQAQAEHHLAALADAFDAAAATIRTPFSFAADISDLARPIAIDGSRELIAAGNHREAVFWLVATYARCQMVLAHDAPPATYAQHDRGFRALLADLGIASPADLRDRTAQVAALLPDVWMMAEAIMAANPEIEDG